MRTKAELRQMRRERGEPGGFGAEEAISLAVILWLMPAAIVVGVGVLLGIGWHAIAHVSDMITSFLRF